MKIGNIMKNFLYNLLLKFFGKELAGNLYRWQMYMRKYRTGYFARFEMDKKNEKSLIVLDDIIQSPLAYTPIKHTLTGNVSGQVSISTSVLSVSYSFP